MSEGWIHVGNAEELQAYFESLLPGIRKVARRHGYAIGVHGSMRRDLDLIAVPWKEDHSDKQVLADAIQKEVGRGIVDTASLPWEEKPCGRLAISLHSGAWPEFDYGVAGLGHIDLSVVVGKTK